jgi:hypothetical protein
MLIYLRIDGEGKRRMNVEESTSVADIKLEVLRLERIRVDHQRVVFRNKELQDETTIAEAGIGENSILNVVLIPRTG